MATTRSQYAYMMSDDAPLPNAVVVSKRPPVEVLSYFFALLSGLFIIYWAVLFNKSALADNQPLPGFGSWADDTRSDEEITNEIRNLRYTRPNKDYSL
jgi:hypothetical protein